MTLLDQNTKRWNDCHVPAEKAAAFQAVADKITVNKAVYQDIEKSTGVPWWFIGIVHYREASLKMNANLAQGDPWNKKSVHVPAGRGPFTSFQEAAVDALTKCSPYAARNKDWSVGSALTMFEKYNGLGYANKNLPSPYVWAGTNQYTSGKYVADGVFDPNAVDAQLGCAGILKFLGVFKSQSNVAGPATGAGIAGVGVTLSQYFHSHQTAIIIGAVLAAVLVGTIVHLYRNK